MYQYSSVSALDACTGGISMTNVVEIGGTLCDGTGIQCDEFNSEIAGLPIWVSDGTNVRSAVIDDPNISGVATYDALCAACSIVTPTSTPTPTITPAACTCNEFLVSINAADTSDATGNTGGLSVYNGVVVWTYDDCDTGLSTEYLLSAGDYNYCACGLGTQLTYWKNNSQYLASFSTATPQGPCSFTL